MDKPEKFKYNLEPGEDAPPIDRKFFKCWRNSTTLPNAKNVMYSKGDDVFFIDENGEISNLSEMLRQLTKVIKIYKNHG